MRTSIAVAVALLGAGCAPHIAPYQPKHRDLDTGEFTASRSASAGSLFRGNAGWMEDDRAGRLGDLLIIQIDEADSASRVATTKLDSSNQSSVGFSGGIVAALQKALPQVDLAKLGGLDQSSNFAGAGNIQRQGRLNATLPVRVRKVLPNDDLFVEGTKVVMVGTEEHHLYISGIVRVADIRADGSVLSSRVADAEIEYGGRGDVSDRQRPGWLTRLLTKIWPF